MEAYAFELKNGKFTDVIWYTDKKAPRVFRQLHYYKKTFSGTEKIRIHQFTEQEMQIK
jgi:hypothetical protein